MRLSNLSKVRQLTSGRARIQTQAFWLRVGAPDRDTGYGNIQRLKPIQKMARVTLEIRVMTERVSWPGLGWGRTSIGWSEKASPKRCHSSEQDLHDKKQEARPRPGGVLAASSL